MSKKYELNRMLRLLKIYYWQLKNWVKPTVGISYTWDEDKRLRPIEVTEFHASSDYPDFVDSYILAAYWLDTDEDLTEEEMDSIADNDMQFIYEKAVNHWF